MRPIFSATGGAALWLLIFAGFWFALNSTLHDMTQADCRRGVIQACEALQR